MERAKSTYWSGVISTPLQFSRQGMGEAIKSLKDYAKNQTEIFQTEKIRLYKDGNYERGIVLPYREELGHDVDTEYCDDDIWFIWQRDSFQKLSGGNPRRWNFSKSGLDICEKHYCKVFDGEETHEKCECPQKYVKVCTDLMNIVKKYTLKN